MHVDYSDEQKQLRRQLQDYFEQLLDPGDRDRINQDDADDVYRKYVRQMGRDGWLALGWPTEYGGQGRGEVDQLIFFEEAQRANAPVPFLALNTVGPALMAHGTDEQKQRFLPAIAAGEIQFAIGYSEPEAGSDLASLTTRAVREGADYVVNGTKVFTSMASSVDYVWLAARTDANAPKHEGISIFIVDTTSPGFSHAPIRTVGDVETYMTYFEDVRIPEEMLVGHLNEGWKLITTQLNHERVGIAGMSSISRKLFSDCLSWCGEPDVGDGAALELPWVQQAMAEGVCRMEAIELMTMRMAWQMEQGEVDPAFASAMKVHVTESTVEVYRLMMDVVGSRGLISKGSEGALFDGLLEVENRLRQINTFGGGVNEVQRELIARLGLGLPRSR